jgi:hypothetical protein
MRKIVFVGIVLAMVAPAMASNLDPAAAKPWAAPWGHQATMTVGPNNAVSLDIDNNNGSTGFFWRLPAVESEMFALSGTWSGTGAPQNSWSEVLIFSCTEGWTDAQIGAYIDATANGNAAIVAKKDGWGMGAPTNLSWTNENITAAATGWGPFTIHAECAEVVIALKVGNAATTTYDLTYTPEPAAALLLGLPMLLVRRRR